MPEVDWNSIFDEVHARPGATKQDVSEFVSSALLPLTSDEAERIRRAQNNPFPKGDPLHPTWKPFDPANWKLPKRSFPSDYLRLLQWANGAECRSGARVFQFFPTAGVRATMLAYHIPQHMSCAVPFAFNGGGVFYLFDMRKPARNGEYPIVCCGAGALGFGHAIKIADSFLAACQGKANVAD